MTMPRGGGRAGGGSRDHGPEAWDDNEQAPINHATKPPPTFPAVKLPILKPLSPAEVASVDKFLEFRNRTRRGPLFATLDPSSLTDKNGKVQPRAGFDPFNDQEAYTSKFQKKKRTVPDVASQDFALQLFPKELWVVLDPKRKNPLWKTVDPADFEPVRTRKRKRRLSTAVENTKDENNKNAEEDSGEESDVVATGRRKAAKGESRSKQRRGMDAEDDYPEGERDADDDGEPDDEPQDSDFEESEDEDNDYNAEQYFDDGDNDGMDDDGGGGGDDYYQ